MEKQPKTLYLKFLAAGSALALSGCGTIHENSEVSACQGPDKVHLKATIDPNRDDYTAAKDPAILSAAMLEDAREDLKKDTSDTLWHNIVTGVGEVACEGTDGQIYLTDAGTSLSLRLSGTD